MKDQLTKEQSEAILKALNETISNGPWDKSHFLKVIGKSLSEIRDDFLTQLGARDAAVLKNEARLADRLATRSEKQEVYVSLYSSDGGNLQSWEKIITNLPRQMISRPIYAEEEQIKTVLKSKENKQNEAYVAIYINKEDILQLSADKSSFDKQGNPLLALKDRIIHLENISRFVHLSGVYEFERNRLKKLP